MSSPTTMKSNLLSLPIELRVMIYGLVFALAKTTIISHTHEIPPNQYPPLLLTCKEIRREAYPEYFRHTPFNADLSDNADLWLDRLPREYVAKISRLRVQRVSHRSRNYRCGKMCSSHRLGLQQAKQSLVEVRSRRTSAAEQSSGSIPAPGPSSSSTSAPVIPVVCSDPSCPLAWREKLIGDIQRFAERYQRHGLKPEVVRIAIPLDPLGTTCAWVGVKELSSRQLKRNEVEGVAWFYATPVPLKRVV